MKKTTKVISAVLSAAIAVVASAAMAVSASASQYRYVENHEKVNCMHRWIENEEAVFSVKVQKAEHRMAYCTVTSKNADNELFAYIDLNTAANEGICKSFQNAYAKFDYSDDQYDYFHVYADITEFDTASIKVYYGQYGDRAMATDTSIGSYDEGNGFFLDKNA